MSETPKKSPKKANLSDQHSIKNLLDESASENVKGRGYPEDFRTSNIKLLLGTVIIAIALFAQFYNKKFPENRDFLFGCIVLLVVMVMPILAILNIFLKWSQALPGPVFNVLLQLFTYSKEKNAILFTYPPAVSFNSTGLVVSSKLPRFSNSYTLTISSADPKSVSANKPAEFTKSITRWFTKEGVLVEALFRKDVEALVDDYNKEPKKGK